jgi:hypothetical protein
LSHPTGRLWRARFPFPESCAAYLHFAPSCHPGGRRSLPAGYRMADLPMNGIIQITKIVSISPPGSGIVGYTVSKHLPSGPWSIGAKAIGVESPTLDQFVSCGFRPGHCNSQIRSGRLRDHPSRMQFQPDRPSVQMLLENDLRSDRQFWLLHKALLSWRALRVAPYRHIVNSDLRSREQLTNIRRS